MRWRVQMYPIYVYTEHTVPKDPRNLIKAAPLGSKERDSLTDRSADEAVYVNKKQERDETERNS